MSTYTEKIAYEATQKTGARAVIFVLIGVNGDPSKHHWTVRAHPLLDKSLPNMLRQMANEIEVKQRKKLHG